MSYKVMTTPKSKKKTDFHIVEKGTEHVVARKSTMSDASKLCRSLNLGSGFNGFTPEFFTIEYPVIK